MVEVGRRTAIFVYFFVSSILLEARSSGAAEVQVVGVQTRSPSSEFQPIFCQVEDGDELVAFHLGPAADVAVLRIEDGLAVSSVSHSIVDDQPKHGHFCVVSVLHHEVSPDYLCHRSLSFPAVSQDSFAEGGLVCPCVAEDCVLGEVRTMVLGCQVQALVHFKGRKRALPLKKPPRLLPGSFALVGLVDNILTDRHFSLIHKGIELLVDKGDEVGGELPCQVDVLDHLYFFALIFHVEC